MKAMLFAAGLGTRLLGETSDKPKALVTVGDRTLLENSIEKLKSAGIQEVVVNVHHFAELVKEFIRDRDFGIPVHISDESECLLDTGGGLKKAAHFFQGEDTILLYNVDVISSLDLSLPLKEHLESGAIATLVVRQRETQRYFKFGDDRSLVGWINKKTGEKKISRPEQFDASTEMAFSGIHLVQTSIFDFVPADDRFSITPLYLELAKTKHIHGYFDTSELWMDVGKPNELTKARSLFSR